MKGNKRGIMKKCFSVALLFTLAVVLYSCGSGMSMEELKTAQWTKLDTGIGYISLKNGASSPSRSIRYSVKGFIGEDMMAMADMNNPGMLSDSVIDALVHARLPQSRRGYLRFDMNELAQRAALTATVYLRHDYDTTRLQQDMQLIRDIAGVQKVEYVSKDQAASRYMAGAGGDSSWKKVLEENPLPASIDFHFERNQLPIARYAEIEAMLRDSLPVSEIRFPQGLPSNAEKSYLIMEYKKE